MGAKEFRGQGGFPTPSGTPETTVCRTFRIPDSAEWLALLMGSLQPLTKSYNWYAWGALTADEAADAFQNIILDAYSESVDGICPVIDAPYWDTAADVGAEADPLAQVWYGLLYDSESSFIENMQNWVIGGFVAYASGLHSAIAFLTLARRFRLAFRQHDAGSIVRVFIDAAQVAEVDTYSASPNIMFVDIFAEKVADHEPPYNLWVEQASSSQLQVIRKELSEAEVFPTNQRYNVDIDEIQTTTDGGDTWVDTPQSDPRHSTYNLLPPVVAGDPKCQAASNMTRWIKDTIDSTLTPISEALDATALLTLLVGLFIELGPFAILIDLILGLALVLFSAGATAIAAAFTSTVYDQLTCIFYCCIETDGSVTPGDLTAITTKIDAQIGGLAATVLDTMLFLMGEIGLSNAGVLGNDPSPNCDACFCGWCHFFDFLSDDGGFVADTYGTWVTGVGWVGSPSPAAIMIGHTFMATNNCRTMRINYDLSGGNGVMAAYYFSGGTYHAITTTEALPHGTDMFADVFVDTTTVDMDNIYFNANYDGGATFVLKSIKLLGDTEPNPVGTDNC